MGLVGLEVRCIGGAEADAARLERACASITRLRQLDEADSCMAVLVAGSTSGVEEIARAAAGLPSGTRTLIYVAPSGRRASLREVAAILQLGIEDVVECDNAEEGLRRVQLTLERWHTIECAVATCAFCRGIVGASPCWRRTIRDVLDAGRFSGAPVLIEGESGTGKELLARLVHEQDCREGKRELVTLDCTTLQRELAGSELFGHVKGSFTGATSSRDGAIALAHQGTLFLDEIGELSLELQASLLRTLQERVYKPVGANAWIESDFRLVCATNRELRREVAAGRFRLDLFHRICGHVCEVPPLRRRVEDIPVLFLHFYNACTRRSGAVLSPAVREYLLRRDYPGNVRELRRLAEATARNDTGAGEITVGMLPRSEQDCIAKAAGPLIGGTGSGSVPVESEALGIVIDAALARRTSLREFSRMIEVEAIARAVDRHGSQRKAASALGVTERALQLRRQRSRP